MPATPLTLMAVHAHPDDEASSTGGLLALSADRGIRTVLVTCTNGENGDDIDAVVIATRQARHGWDAADLERHGTLTKLAKRITKAEIMQGGRGQPLIVSATTRVHAGDGRSGGVGSQFL